MVNNLPSLTIPQHRQAVLMLLRETEGVISRILQTAQKRIPVQSAPILWVFFLE